MINGMQLCKKFFKKELLPLIKKEFDVKVTVGLFGYGSECYGYDDHISRDHDFSVMPVILVKEEDYINHGIRLNKILEKLSSNFMGFNILNESYFGKDRRGILKLEDFVYTFLGSDTGPTTDYEFRNIPQHQLSSFTNGEIFLDQIGTISNIRDRVKYYPEDIRLNMIATRCMKLNSAFVNYERSVMRNEQVAAYQARSEFLNLAIEMFFLLNKKYCPYYKWQDKMLREIDNIASKKINALSKQELNFINVTDNMHNICMEIIKRLEKQNLIVYTTSFIGYYGLEIQNKIRNSKIRQLGCWSD